MIVVYVLDVAEFRPVVEAARKQRHCRISYSSKGYWRIESEAELVLSRKEMGLKPAVWYGIFTGGLIGEIAEFGREQVRIIGTNKPL